MKKTTLKELAQILNLSVSTISKALNDSIEIPKKTKIKVRKTADEYGYVPNYLARSLKLGVKQKTIGLVIPNVTGGFFAKVLHGIEKEASTYGYKVFVCITDDKHIKEKESLQSLIKDNVDGILISFAEETQRKNKTSYIENFFNHNLPIVQFDRVYDKLVGDKITINDFDSAYTATEYLIETGCKKIGFITTISKTSIGELRKEGYLIAIKLNGHSHDGFIFNIENYDGLKKMLKKAICEHQIDAFLITDELSAFCTLNTIQALGYKVPNDVSIIGFTNGYLTRYSNPSITTVCHQASNMGSTAANILISRIESKNIESPSHTIIKTKLTIGNSTKKLI
ncbi:LacI family DNA-binding transcriptional regulator [uncultured Maribacter sp.]|uniref:LacI family DNA-binding transcriptional regulator n=1 Tax=uncultured Maribacter sp. TaxID=431308 RepID=UPI00261C2693|nr:LacI family DNA-binding transcriptional regulator [uncultured Maribacter sp.]